MKKKFTTIILAVSLLACKKQNPFEFGAKSTDELVSLYVQALSANDQEKIRQLMIRRHEYVDGIHPYTPEAKGSDGLEYWQTFIVRKRDIITGSLIDQFKGKQCKGKVIGKAAKIEKHGPVTFYRETPVQFECRVGDKTSIAEDRSTFGIIVEKYGTYKLLNIFND